MSFIYITHKLFEVFQIASRAAVMRDGKYIGSRNVNEVTENDLVAMMVGRKISNLYGTSQKKSEKNALFQSRGPGPQRLF